MGETSLFRLNVSSSSVTSTHRLGLSSSPRGLWVGRPHTTPTDCNLKVLKILDRQFVSLINFNLIYLSVNLLSTIFVSILYAFRVVKDKRPGNVTRDENSLTQRYTTIIV